eukprot:TRINITY_DN1242_c0_g1_i1.p1 TRINITY_DN1242_c0_g1~~TRINITY_DN1242_c0_g1_i1.p1  ORF type:complete len:186 (+),score=4.81 TRINITY_DN1242_c0_g1_i1:140-697(+)
MEHTTISCANQAEDGDIQRDLVKTFAQIYDMSTEKNPLRSGGHKLHCDPYVRRFLQYYEKIGVPVVSDLDTGIEKCLKRQNEREKSYEPHNPSFVEKEHSRALVGAHYKELLYAQFRVGPKLSSSEFSRRPRVTNQECKEAKLYFEHYPEKNLYLTTRTLTSFDRLHSEVSVWKQFCMKKVRREV